MDGVGRFGTFGYFPGGNGRHRETIVDGYLRDNVECGVASDGIRHGCPVTGAASQLQVGEAAAPAIGKGIDFFCTGKQFDGRRGGRFVAVTVAATGDREIRLGYMLLDISFIICNIDVECIDLAVCGNFRGGGGRCVAGLCDGSSLRLFGRP